MDVSRDNLRLVALLPMRATSERVLNKNLKPLGGQPLFRHILDTLLSLDEVSEVVINTDSPEIAELASKTDRKVTIVERPEHLRSGHTPMNAIIRHDLSVTQADWYLQTHATNPFLSSETIRAAYRQLLADDSFDSLFSVTALQTRLWTSTGAAINHDPNVLLRTQDLEKVYEENSNMYFFRKESFQKRDNRIGERPRLFEVPRYEAWDIDDGFDFELAETLFQRGMRGGDR